MIKTVMRGLGFLLLAVCVLAVAGWSALAIDIAGPLLPSLPWLRRGLAAVPVMVAIAAVIALFLPRWRWRFLLVCVVLFGVMLAWWSTVQPSNARQWQPDVAVLPSATIEGDLVTVHNVRNFAYRSEFDYTPAYYDKTYDLRELRAVDVVAVYWMGPAIAHVLLSFQFGEDDHLAISIETRKEVGESYSTINGFFRQYELYYVVADERDVIGLRTHYRANPPEDVYVYRLAGNLDDGRRVFLEYIRRINQLKEAPEFYNTLTTNCTTSIWMNTWVNARHLAFNWKILVSGYLPELLYESGRLEAGGQDFAEVQRRAHINARARAADIATDFSRRIRHFDENLGIETP